MAASIAAAFLIGAFSCAFGKDAGLERDFPGRNGREMKSESLSFIILGDLHWCDRKNYDLDVMLEAKPGDYKQITATYSPVTETNWQDLVGVLKERIRVTDPEVRCIVQLGDLSEGLANTPGGASQMAREMVDVMKSADFGVPLILAKGNHDITGVGDICRKEARTAFIEYITPYIKEQTGAEVENACYSYRTGDVLFVVLDSYDSSVSQISFLRESLEESDAKYKFVCMHEPAIPATERCWHYLKQSEEERSEFLRIIAENRAIFLCGHLHRYSVLRRNTEWGPVVQVMANTVTDLKRKVKPGYEFGLEDYGPALVEWKPDYSPSNREWRLKTLAHEAAYVDYYKMNNLSGYGVISIDGKRDKVTLEYYAAWSDEPYDSVNLTELLNGK